MQGDLHSAVGSQRELLLGLAGKCAHRRGGIYRQRGHPGGEQAEGGRHEDPYAALLQAPGLGADSAAAAAWVSGRAFQNSLTVRDYRMALFHVVMQVPRVHVRERLVKLIMVCWMWEQV